MFVLVLLANIIEAFLCVFITVSLAMYVITELLVLPAILIRVMQGKFKTSVFFEFLKRMLVGLIITGVLATVTVVFDYYASRLLVKLEPYYLIRSFWITQFVQGGAMFTGVSFGILLVSAIFIFPLFDKKSESIFRSTLKEYEKDYAKT